MQSLGVAGNFNVVLFEVRTPWQLAVDEFVEFSSIFIRKPNDIRKLIAFVSTYSPCP